MSKYGTIKIPRDEYEKHNEKRKAAGLTWAEYLNEETARPSPAGGIAEEVRELRRAISNDTEVDYAEIERRCERAVESALPKR